MTSSQGEATGEIEFQTTITFPTRKPFALFTLILDIEEWKKLDGMSSGVVVIRKSTAIKDGR